MNKRIIILVIFFCLLFAVMPVNTGVTEGEQCSARAGGNGLTAHDPIYINGNSNFTVANGVRGGSGTAADPYIIENWDINASNAIGMDIRNTDKYFVIRNCVVHDGWKNIGPSNYGIYFYSVKYGSIDNVTSYNNCLGISLYSSSNNTLTNCDVYNNSVYGIYLDSSSNNTITNCYLYNNSNHGIYLSSSSNNNTITTCCVYNNYGGIILALSLNNEVHYCNIYNNTYYGVSNYNTISEYRVNATYNWWGSASGPYNNITNTNGTGDNVTDNVLYEPWLTKTVKINNPPTLSNGTVSPLSGYLDTVFKFVITYTDEDNNTPAYVNVIIDNTDSYNMTKQNVSDDNYIDGCVYENSTTLPIGSHFYYFNASDGINMTVYPSASCINITHIYGLGVTEKEEQKTWVQQGISYFILIVIIIVVEILVSAVFLIMRKRTMILKCPKCGTIFKVKRKKEAFKVECPTCGAEGTIKSAAEKKTSPKKPTRTLRCPRCEQAFTVEEKTKPFSVKCPYCGKEGTIR